MIEVKGIGKTFQSDTRATQTMTNLDKLKDLLAELFMLDQADLDFGIYRVMNAKRAEVTRFLDHDLLPQVRTELEKISTGDRAGLETELAKAIAAARAAGFSAEQAEQSPDNDHGV